MPPDIASLDEFELAGKRVLVRLDINSPLDPVSGEIVNDNRIDRSLPTIRDLADAGARVVILAHQGDALDYQNFASLSQHAGKLADKLSRPVSFIDDCAGPAARARIAALENGEILLLENIRIYSEEMTTFESTVKLTPAEMTSTYLVRHLAPLFDLYVNDAFAAAHRRAPSLLAFQEVLPSAGGRLLIEELEMLERVSGTPARPCVFVLGGLKISDAFAMLERALTDQTADLVLTSGVTGEIMLMAAGHELGPVVDGFISDRGLDVFLPTARRLLELFPDAILMPDDVAVERNGDRCEVPVAGLPVDQLIIDIGSQTISRYEEIIGQAATVFVNGPPGVYESSAGAEGTARLWSAVAATPGLTVIGGGDTVGSAARFIDLSLIDYVSTAGGALIRYLSGQPLPLLDAMERRT
ncbi:MAG: phosphoglycerate kinase [Acidimicrobiia bacterium]|nr:phosphoglycerate kinase [Acidimicrobiia bacterium]NNL13418.1 phosphoglycerate kinase [Acidimicrobiia bacterium]RZV45677.1 MAG: phosphoglycerate kinase [Acidimicrobiia bacterium]